MTIMDARAYGRAIQSPVFTCVLRKFVDWRNNKHELGIPGDLLRYKEPTTYHDSWKNMRLATILYSATYLADLRYT